MSDIDVTPETAASLMLAVACDSTGDPAALRYYLEGICGMLEQLKTTPDGDARTAFREKIAKFLTRAEEIKATLERSSEKGLAARLAKLESD